jgi:hypothetical protein
VEVVVEVVVDAVFSLVSAKTSVTLGNASLALTANSRTKLNEEATSTSTARGTVEGEADEVGADTERVQLGAAASIVGVATTGWRHAVSPAREESARVRLHTPPRPAATRK